MPTHVLQGVPAEYEKLLRAAARKRGTLENWTIPKNAATGDTVYFYLSAPVSAFIAKGTVAAVPEKENDKRTRWFGRYFAPIRSMRPLARDFTLDEARQGLRKWSYLRSAQGTVTVPEAFEARLERLLASAPPRPRLDGKIPVSGSIGSPSPRSKQGGKLTDLLTEALLEGYQLAGEEAGHWAHRYRQALLRSGGVATAKRMLGPRTTAQRKGLDAILGAGHPEHTMEAIILRPPFRMLFTAAEQAVASERLGQHIKTAKALKRKRERLFPDELEPGRKYFEGARRQVRVNAYERDPAARDACIKHHGAVCDICEFSFSATYGKLGRGFIHVHHLRPLALTAARRELDPVADLTPVCPNCHSMLHRTDPPLSPAKLKKLLSARSRH